MKKIRNIILIAIILMAVTINTSCYAKIEDEIKVDTSIQVSANHGGGGRSRATDTTTSDLSGTTIINPDKYKPTEVKGSDLGTTGESKVQSLIGLITIIGILVSIASIIILGIKYMVGSIEERAEYKKTMLPMVIGMIFLFGTSTIISIINSIVNG